MDCESLSQSVDALLLPSYKAQANHTQFGFLDSLLVGQSPKGCRPCLPEGKRQAEYAGVESSGQIFIPLTRAVIEAADGGDAQLEGMVETVAFMDNLQISIKDETQP